ncbi:MAG: glycosyltransferase family 2 protein, partial [Candidatus Cryptobacteroides sp.]
MADAQTAKTDAAARADAPESRMRIGIVILNWNTRNYLEKFLPPLIESSEVFNAAASENAADIIVADNASSDGSLEFVRTGFPSIRTIALDRNYGFTGGYNRAIGELIANPGTDDGGSVRPYDCFVLLNSDIEVDRDWIAPLAKWMQEHPDCGACGPKLHSWYERDKFEYAGAAGGLIDRFGYPFCRGRVMKRLETDKGQYDEPRDVLWITGACLMTRRETWIGTGGLDDRFFAHMEEIDLCWRMQAEGWKVTVVPQSVVWHLGGGTLPAESPQKLYLNYRNNILLLEKNLGRTIGRRKAAVRIFARKLLDGCSALLYLASGKTDYFKSVIRAHRDAKALSDAAGSQPVTSGNPEAGVRKIRGIYGKCMIPRALLGI